MCENRGATSPPLTPPPVTSFHLSQNVRMKEDKCFNCQKQGHWARECPNKTPTKSTTNFVYPMIQCRCGAPCSVLVSKTEKNPGRRFYTCPEQGSGKCHFFKWVDRVTREDTNLSVIPNCPCGAGICRKLTEDSGPNMGRSYYVCPIKKGLGACPFKWDVTVAYTDVNEHLDKSKGYGSPQSICESHKVFDILNNELQKNDDLSFEQHERIEIPNSEVMPTSSAQAHLLLTENEEFGKTSNIASANEDGPSPYVAPQNENSVSNSTEGDPVIQEVSWGSMVKASRMHLMSPSEIHCRQMEFWRQISAAGDISTGDIFYQSLGLQVLGWLGRLVFPPPRGLKDRPPGPFFCGIFPSFDPIFVPQDSEMLKPVGSTPSPHRLSNNDLDRSSPPIPVHDLQKRSGLKRSSYIIEDDNVAELISRSLEQTALHIQNQLVMILNSIDPSDHDSMTKAAHTFFSLLDGTSIDYEAFSGHVREFIYFATTLSDIERSIFNEHSLQECTELYNVEKARFDDISKVHEKAVAAFTSSSGHLQTLQEEASRLRDMFQRIENQLLCCEAETSELKTHVDVTNKDMLESKRSMQKAEEALKLRKQREEERNAAKAALEKTCWSMKEECGLRLRKRPKF